MKLKVHYRAFNSGGKGGQHGNRTLSAIEATVELPGGRVIRATSQTLKSQHQNKRASLAILRARVADAMRPEAERRATAGWGNAASRVRTYHEPDNRVTDTSGARFSYSEIVGKGDLGPAIEARWAALAGREAGR